MRHLGVAAMLIAFGAIPSTAMADSACPTNMYDRADASLPSAAVDWRSLLSHHEKFVWCDDGALAEGYSDAVVTLLAHRWAQFRVFSALARRNPAFPEWAIRHIDASASSDDLKKLARNAAACVGSVQAKQLCQEVAKAARDALKD